jgi:hypothetical protein
VGVARRCLKACEDAKLVLRANGGDIRHRELLVPWVEFLKSTISGTMLYGPIMAHCWMTGYFFHLYVPDPPGEAFPWPVGAVDFSVHLYLACGIIETNLREWGLWTEPRHNVQGQSVPGAPQSSHEDFLRNQNLFLLRESVNQAGVNALVTGGPPTFPMGFNSYVALPSVQARDWKWTDNPSGLEYMWSGQTTGFFIQGKGDFVWMACRTYGYEAKLCCFRGCSVESMFAEGFELVCSLITMIAGCSHN